MTTDTMTAAGIGAAPRKRSMMTWVWILAGFVIVGLIAYHARMGVVSPRIANPEVTGVPRPVEFSHGSDFPIQEMQWGTVGMMVVLIAVCVWAWRRRPGHPYVLMTIAATGIVWQDPIMNWAPYAVYNPQLWHWPETWPLVSLSQSSRQPGRWAIFRSRATWVATRLLMMSSTCVCR